MYIVHVIPITRQLGTLESLSYFTFKDIPVGSIVNVPIRKNETPALVLRKEDAGAIKALLRTQKYIAKNIRDPKPRKLLSSEFIKAIQETAEYFITPIGPTLNSFIPTAILKDSAEHTPQALVSRNKNDIHEIITVQATSNERLNAYKTILRTAFARGESTLLIVPTINKANECSKLYKKGIEKYIYTLHSGLSAKIQRDLWQQALSQKHPVLIIATHGFISIPRADIGVIIIEEEGSEMYKKFSRPYIDTRLLIHKFAKILNAKLILGDILLQSSTHKMLAEGKAIEFEKSSLRMRSGAKILSIDMSYYTKKAKEEKLQYPILSEESEKVIIKSNKSNKHIFILVNKRGHASQTVCQDCGSLVLCNRCGTPMALHGKADSRTFLCHTCGEAKDAKTLCSYCGSWHLKSLGIGIEAMEETITKITDLPVLRIDSDSTKTEKKIKENIDTFYDYRSAILLGTSMVLPYLSKKVDVSIIPSLDALLAVPDFTAEERAFRIILRLAELTSENVLIQTRTPKNKMLHSVKQRAIAEFMERELSLRKKFIYPPYATFIKISIIGNKKYIIQEVKKILDDFREFKPRVFRNFEPTKNGKYILHTLIRFNGDWPDNKLSTLIYSLPQSFMVQII